MAEDSFDHYFVAPTDFDRTVDFYARNLGWTTISTWGDARQGRGAVLQRGDMQVALAERHTDDLDDRSSLAINQTRPTLYIAVDDLEARFADIPDKSVVVIAPERTHWGARWFVVRDPDGNLIAFTECA